MAFCLASVFEKIHKINKEETPKHKKPKNLAFHCLMVSFYRLISTARTFPLVTECTIFGVFINVSTHASVCEHEEKFQILLNKIHFAA